MLVSVDFETYYDTDYSITKMSTSEYIRDPRFEAICASIKMGNGKPRAYWGHDKIQAALDAVNWKKNELLAHHAHFEGLILSHHFAIRPSKYRDTLSMSRALYPKTERNDLATLAARLEVANKLTMPNFKGKRLADFTKELKDSVEEYVNGDVESCAQAYAKMVELFPPDELELINITVQMFADPVLKLDKKLAEQELQREKDERAVAIAKSSALTYATALQLKIKPKKKGDPITDMMVLSSNKIFPQLLKHIGIDPPMKISKTTLKPTYALSKSDEEFTDLITHPDPKVSALVSGRLAAKSTIGETRAARLLRSGARRQSLPVYLNYFGAHTGRWSGGDKLNYQNLKKKGDIRKAILAPKGHSLVVIDSAQIEARVTAWLAGEEWLLEAFRQKRDVYSEFATVAFNRPIDRKRVVIVDGKKTLPDFIEGFVGKTCILGLGFQMGGPKLQKSILVGSIIQGLPEPVRLELSRCYELVSAYRQKNARIEALWGYLHNEVVHDLAFGVRGSERKYKCISYGREFIRLPNGLKLLYPEARATLKRKNAGGLAAATYRIEDGSYRTLEGRTKIYGGLLTENIVQALARIIVAQQMLEIAKKYRIVMMTHDEIVFLVKTKLADAALKWGLEVMSKPLDWCPDLPVACEGGHDVRYSK